MFARSVAIRLKRNTAGEFIAMFESEAIPLLRQQEGFQQVLTLITPDGKDVVAISLWSNKVTAEAYHLQGYEAVLERLAKVLEGSPQVKTYEVCNSTVGSTFTAPASLSRNS